MTNEIIEVLRFSIVIGFDFTILVGGDLNASESIFFKE